jgi:hypothetical protein
MSNVYSTLHQSDIPCSKGERLFRGRSKHSNREINPKESSSKGVAPRGEWPFSIDVKGGEMIH